MPAIWTFGPSNVTGIDLGANAFWRLALGAVHAQSVPWLSLNLIYPPAAGQTIQQTQISLARSGVSLTDKVEDVLRIADVSVSMGSQERDRERMTEAFNLFKNNGKVRQETLEADLKGALTILDAYWDIRSWLFEGATDVKDLPVGSYLIKLRP
jgi:hypothetical protein